MTGKDGPRRYQIRQAWLSRTQDMQVISSSETVAFFRGLAAETDQRVSRNRILNDYPHATKEVRRKATES